MKHNALIALLTITPLQADNEPRDFTVRISNVSSSVSGGWGQPAYHAPYYAPPRAPQHIPPARAAAPEAPSYYPTYEEPSTPSYYENPVTAPVARSRMPSVQDLQTYAKDTLFSINPLTITAGALFSLYVVYQIKMYNLAQYALKGNTWSTWKEHIPLEVMVEVPHQEVAEELFNAIKSKYVPVHGADMMTPMVKFNNAIEHEMQKLNQFLQLQEWLSYTKLSYLFPSYEKETAVAKVKIKRLVFFKDVLLAWMNEYSTAIIHDRFIPNLQKPEEIAPQECFTNPITATECS